MMWLTTFCLLTLCLVSEICEGVPAFSRKRDLKFLKDGDVLEENRITRKTWKTKVEDYEGLDDYIERHGIRGVPNDVGFATERPKKDNEVDNSLRDEIVLDSMFGNDSAISDPLNGQEVKEELQKDMFEELSPFDEPEKDKGKRVKRMSVIGVWGCPVGMIRYPGLGCFRKIH